MIEIYSCVDRQLVIPGGVINQAFDLHSFGRTLKLKSIFWDFRIHENLTGIPLNLATQNTQTCILDLGDGIDTITKRFNDFTFPATIQLNGTGFGMLRPGQIIFNSFFIREHLHFNFTCANGDLLISYVFWNMIVVECEALCDDPQKNC